MFSGLMKTLLVMTSLSPIALVYSWVSFTESYYTISLFLVFLCVILYLSTSFILVSSERYLERFKFSFTSVEPVDQENVSFLLFYLSPLFVDKLSSVNFNVVVPAFVIYALLTSASYAYHFNPLLGLMGWHFFKITSEEGVSYVIITRNKIKNVDSISEVGQLSDYMLIDFTGK